MVGVGGELWRPTYPTSLFTQGYLHPVAQDFVQMAFEYLKAIWTLCSLHGPPLPVLVHPHSKKSASLCSDRTFHVSVCACCFSYCHWTPPKEVGPVFFGRYHPFRYLYTVMRFSQAFSPLEREYVPFCLVYKHNPCYKHYPKHSLNRYLPRSNQREEP